MSSNIALQTAIPILLLVGAGLASRRWGLLKSGDERVLSAYIYYFALPALFVINIAETNLVEEGTLSFVSAGITPVLIVLAIYVSLYFILRFSESNFTLVILSTIFGSLAFFGIPFISFAYPDEGEHLATLSAASIALVSVTISISILELRGTNESMRWKGIKHVMRKLSKNPLIISILIGILLSLIGLRIPAYVSTPIHTLGSTTSPVAIFMLGVFLYGRKYTNFGKALKLCLLRMLFLPIIAFLTTTAFGLPVVERSTLVLMHSMPVAISMIVLSERYNFHKETIASLVLLSSFSAILYLNLWLLILNYF